MLKNIFFILCFIIYLPNTFAQNTFTDSLKTAPKKVTYMLGAGLGLAPRYEGGKRYFVIPSLVFNAKWNTGQYIRLSMTGIAGNILKHDKLELGPKFGFRVPRNYNLVKTKAVSNLEELNLSVLAGAFSRYRFSEKFDIKAEFIQDITSVSNGSVGVLELSYTSRVKRWVLNYSAVMSFASNKYMDTYFGVNNQNRGTSQLQDYNPNGGLKDIGFRLTETFMFNQHWMLTYSLTYRYFIGDAGNSPLIAIGSKNQLVGGAVFMYRF